MDEGVQILVQQLRSAVRLHFLDGVDYPVLQNFQMRVFIMTVRGMVPGITVMNDHFRSQADPRLQGIQAFRVGMDGICELDIRIADPHAHLNLQNLFGI
ncbi:hypothetical protein D3C75_436980 [compost metagenome]